MLLSFVRFWATAAMLRAVDAQSNGPTAYPQTANCCDGLLQISQQCYSACMSLGTSCESSLENAEEYLLSQCGQIPAQTLLCLKNDTVGMLECCEKSSNPSCIATCTEVVTSGSNDIAALVDACGPPVGFGVTPDPVYECFLLYTDDTPSEEPKTVTAGTLCSTDPPPDVQTTAGADLARLQCCTHATDTACQESCMKVFSLILNDGNYETLHYDCLHRPSEAPLVGCLDDVSSECRYGCSGLLFCSNFNLKSHSLYRRCNDVGDSEAKHLHYQWLTNKVVANPLISFAIKDPSECMPSVWKEVACATTTKPCHPDTHTSLICRDDCMQLMRNCSNDTNNTPREICDVLSPLDLQENCIPLASLTEEHKDVSPMELAAATSPCNSSPCFGGTICSVNRDCLAGDSLCVPYTCLPSCELGGTQVLMEHKTALSLPMVEKAHILVSAESDQHCYGYINKTGVEVESCGYRKEAGQQYCENMNLACVHEGQSYAHNEVFNPDECNFCLCYYGRLICSNHSCLTGSQSRIPCDCPTDLFDPVCAPDGRTFPNSCFARCSGFSNDELETGQCDGSDPCSSSSCPSGSRCVPHRHVCLFGGPPSQCPQYICEPVGAECSSTEAVCDKNGNEHDTLCEFLPTAEKLDYWGHCKEDCSSSRRNPVCGVNGETYASRCHARGSFIAVDYNEPCNSIPGENGKCLRKECSQVFFNSEEVCVGPDLPNACCPKCGALVRVLMDKTLLRRSKEVMDNGPFISTTIIERLRRLVDTRYCDLFGHVALDDSLNLLVLPENASFWFNVDTCNIQARSLAALINTQSPILRSDPFLAHLVAANVTIADKITYQQTVTVESVKDPDEPSGCIQTSMALQALLLSLAISCWLSVSMR